MDTNYMLIKVYLLSISSLTADSTYLQVFKGPLRISTLLQINSWDQPRRIGTSDSTLLPRHQKLQVVIKTSEERF